jgi:hypothetical protein
MLMGMMVMVVPPLSDFRNFLLHFLHGFVSSAPDVMAALASPAHGTIAANYAAYSLHKLRVTCEAFTFVAPAKDSPELARALAQKEAGQQIECLRPFMAMTSVQHVADFRERTMSPASCRIHLVDGTQMDYTAAPWQTNVQVVAALCEALKIKDPEYHALYEMRGVDLQYLYGTDNLLDVQLAWTKAERKAEAKKQKVSAYSRTSQIRPLPSFLFLTFYL